MTRKQAIIIGAAILILGLVFFGAVLTSRSRSKKEAEPTSPPEALVPTKTIEEIPPTQRPFIGLVPSDDGHWLTLYINNTGEAKTIEYELIYETAGPTQGAIGTIDFKKRKSPIEEKILLGTESRGKFKYDEGVEKGKLELVFREKGQDVKYNTEFHLQSASQAKNTLTSLDDQFSFKAKTNLAKGFYITMPTIGFPKTPEGEIVIGPYGIFTSASSKKTGRISFEVLNPPPKAQVYGWDKTTEEVKEYSANLKISQDSISVDVGQLTTFIAITPKGS